MVLTPIIVEHHSNDHGLSMPVSISLFPRENIIPWPFLFLNSTFDIHMPLSHKYIYIYTYLYTYICKYTYVNLFIYIDPIERLAYRPKWHFIYKPIKYYDKYLYIYTYVA